ncbi:lipopolysaccharide biosynthesis protein [Natronomonas marina]|uniref:lipopolysaccharide biosynthesis protein n=1 Tax=Natronomonas marina TaxID=2961939 RepID=UPI0020C9C110|nr:lipopolysaccharide biosynthesis protein [Natronomonas marina]
MRIGQKSFVVFVSKFLGSALGFVATIYFANVLGSEVLGYYAAVLALVAWLRLAGDFGVGSAMRKRISEGDEPAAYLVAGFALVGALATAIAAAVLLAGGLVDDYVGRPVAAFVALLVLTELFRLSTIAALEGERLVHVAGLLSPLKIGVRSLVQIGLVVAGLGLTGMLVGYAVGGVLVGVAGLTVVSVGIARPERRHVESLVDFAKFSWLGKLQARSFNDVDVLVLTALVPSGLVGVYYVAWRVTKFLTLFGSAISSTMFPELSRADAEGSEETVSTLVTDALTYNGLLIIPGLVGSALIGRGLLRIYGPEFVQGATVLWVLVLAALVYGYQEQLMYALNALDRPDIAFRVNLVFIVSNVLLNVVLVVAIGFLGAAIATAISATLGLTLSYLALRSLASFRVPVGEIGRQVAAAAAMGVVVALGRRVAAALDPSVEFLPVVTANAVTVGALVVLGAAAYFLSLLGLSAQFRATVLSNLPASVRP